MDEEKKPLLRSRNNTNSNRENEPVARGSINDDLFDSSINQNSENTVFPIPDNSDNCFAWRDFESSSEILRSKDHGHLNPGPEVGPLDANLESLDYDNCENEIFMTEEKTKSFKELKVKCLARWIVMFFIGIFTALIACIIDMCVSTMSNVKFGLLVYYFDQCQTKEKSEASCLLIPLSIWVSWNVICVAIASFVTVYGEPVAAGSGIGQIKCFLNGIKIPHVVRIKTLICKVVGVTCSVVGGLAVGKEGPMIHSGAVVAAGVSQGRSTTFGFDLKLFEYFRTDQEKRDFVSGGAAAGVSAAFGAPVGGVLFSLEEGASFWNQSLTWRIFFASIVSTFSLNIILSWFNGIPWQLSHPGLINFGKFQDMKYSAVEIPFFILIGILGGLFGALFNFINLHLTMFRMRRVRRPFLKFIEAMLVASTTTACAYLLIFFDRYCQPIGRDPNPNPLQMFCPDGMSSSMATLWFQSPESSLKSLFHDPFGTYELTTLIGFGLCYYLLACWTYGCSVPSGLFIPSLVIGASWGRLLGILLRTVWTFDPDWINPGKFALLGAASQLGGVVRMTLSLTVILIEATGNISFALPLMVVLMVAKWTGDFFNEGIYDLHIQISGVPFLGAEPPILTSNILAREVMSYPVTTLQEVDTVRHVVDVLSSENHDAFPVVNRSMSTYTKHGSSSCNNFGILSGLITRSQLIVLLRRQYFVKLDVELEQLKMSDFREIYPRFPKIQDVRIQEDDMDKYIDMRSIMNPAPYTVYENTSLPRLFKLFRGLGLSHLMVIDRANNLIGVVTRKDLARYKVFRKYFWRKPTLYELPMAIG